MYNNTVLYKLSKPMKSILAILLIVGGLTIIDRDLARNMSEVPVRAVTVAKSVDPKQLLCLAENIFYEAGSESFLGQVAVARVVLNRIHYGFAKTPCGVVHQKTVVIKDGTEKTVCQFSWTCEDVRPINPGDPRYQQSKQIAYQVLAYNAYSEHLPRSVLFFHNTTVDPAWPYHRVKQIGNHIFYSKTKLPKNEQPR